jgi:2-keto-4-pentenoate hydratase
MTDIADRVIHDIRTGAPFAPRQDEIEDMTHAYRIQAKVTAALLADVPGRRIAGYKIAFNKGASMEYYGTSEPCYAPMFSDHIHVSGSTLAMKDFNDLVIEPEIAVRLRAPLAGGEDDATVAAAMTLMPAIEVMDPRGAFALDPSAAATVAQRVHSKGAVLGPDYSGDAPDIADIFARLTVAGAPAGEAKGAAPQTPVDAVAWLAGRLAKDGLPLDAGMIIMTGTHLPARRTSELGEVVVTMEPLGAVSMTLV